MKECSWLSDESKRQVYAQWMQRPEYKDTGMTYEDWLDTCQILEPYTPEAATLYGSNWWTITVLIPRLISTGRIPRPTAEEMDTMNKFRKLAGEAPYPDWSGR